MNFFNQKQGMKAFTDMKEALHKVVYESVGKQLVEESKLQQHALNEQLGDRIQKFTEDVIKTAKEIIEKEFESKIRQIVQEEIKLH